MRILVLALMALSAFGQTKVLYNYAPLGFVVSFKPTITGDHTSLGCTPGVTAILYDSGYYLCTGTNTWTAVSTGSGCAVSGSAGQVVTDNGAGACTSNAAFTYATGTVTLGTAGSLVGALKLLNATSGSLTLAPPTGALGTVTVTVPAATDTLVNLAGTQTLVNKTLTAPVMTAPVLGIPASGTLTNATGLPVAGLSNLGTNVGTFLTTPTSANLAAALTNETGTGAAVFANTPALVTPDIGAATGTSLALTGGVATGSATNACDGLAGCIQLGQGTAPSGLATTGIQVIAPTAVTSYRDVRPGTVGATGVELVSVSGTIVTHSYGVTTVAAGGTGTSGTLTGLVRGNASAMTAAELSGDATTSGSNAVTVAKVNGIAYSATAAAHSVEVVTTANTTATAKAIPDCTDTSGNHLNFTQSTDAFSCGTSSSGGGAAGATLFSTTGSTTSTATSATTLIGTATGSTTVAANTFTAGQVLHFIASGYYSTPATPVSLTIDLKIGGTTRITTGAVVQLASVTNGVWNIYCDLTTRTTGASGTQIANCIFVGTGSTLTPGEAPLFTSSAWTIDTTATEAIDLQATWSTATGGPTITSTNVAAWIPGAPVTSGSFTGGLITRTLSGTVLADTVAGTSGGIVCFTGASTWASSAALTNHTYVVGAGAGSCPTALDPAFTTQTDGATITWAIASAPVANGTVTLGGNRTLNITNPLNGGSYNLKIVQDGTGSRGLTLGTGCTWKVSGGGAAAITPTTTASAIDILSFTYDGTNCYANFSKNFN